MEELLKLLAGAITEEPWLAPLLALLAGVLTSFFPCSFSSIPLIIGFVGGLGERNTKKAFVYSVIFATGTAVTFVVLGIVAASAGMLMGAASKRWYLVLGTLMVLMALQTWELYSFIPTVNLLSKSKMRGYLGAFLAGILAGVFSSPCSTPVLVALLAIVAGKGNLLWGSLLMLLYAVGHSTLVIAAGTSVGFVQRIKTSEKYGKTAGAARILMGLGILAIGLYMFWLGF